MKSLPLVLGLALSALLVLFLLGTFDENDVSAVDEVNDTQVNNPAFEGSSSDQLSKAGVANEAGKSATNFTSTVTEQEQEETDTTEGFQLDPLDTLDIDEVNQMAKRISFLQQDGSALNEQQLAELAQLQSDLYGLLAQHPSRLYAESPLRHFMAYLTPEQVLKIERLVSSQSNATQ